MAQEHVEVIIIGGGIAGLATAYHLAKSGQRGVLLLDREDIPGFYASGHNAGIARQLTGRAEHTQLTIEGRKALERAGLLDPCGGWLLGADPGGTDGLFQEASDFSLPVVRHRGTPREGLRAVDHLSIPSDGIIDIHKMVHYCAAQAKALGVAFQWNCEVLSIRHDNRFSVSTNCGTFHAPVVVNAAGAWCGEIGRMAGGLDIPFSPLRRHLIWSSESFPSQLPWIWWADRLLYLRPESGGLLMCACEEEETALPAKRTQPAESPLVLETLYQRLKELAPAYAERPITRLWCGIRTFSPDRRFVLGEDPLRPGLFWAAGLGGHGMTSGLAVGKAVASAMAGQVPAELKLLEINRFLPVTSSQ